MRYIWLMTCFACASYGSALMADPSPAPDAAGAAAQGTTDVPVVDALSFVNQRHGLALYNRLVTVMEAAAAQTGETDEPQVQPAPVQPAPVQQEPVQPTVSSSPVQVRGLAGVFIVLRYRGIWIGHGQAGGAEIVLSPDGTSDLNQAGEMALSRAMEVAKLKLKELGLRPRQPSDTDKQVQSRQMTLHEALPQMTLDVQIAHNLQPIVLGTDSTRLSIFETFIPGYDGLFASMIFKGEKKPRESWMWPGRAVSLNMNPESQVVQLVRQLGLAPEAWDQLGKPQGPVLMKFQCVQVVQSAGMIPGQPRPGPVVLTRGNPEIPPAGLTLNQTLQVSDRIANHLLMRIRSKGDLLGVYYPSGNIYRPQIAGVEEQAIVALALARYTRRQSDKNIRQSRPSLHEAALVRLVSNIETELQLARPDDLIAARALLAMAIMDAPALSDRKELRDKLMSQILAQFRGDAGWVEKTNAKSGQPAERDMPPTVQAIVLSALSRQHQIVQDPAIEPIIASTYGRLMLSIDPAKPAAYPTGILPWLGESRPRIQAIVAPDALRSLDERTRAVAEQIRQLQVLSPPRNAPDDVVGAFNIKNRTLGAIPDPDWHSAQALHFLAHCLNTPQLIAEENKTRSMVACYLGCRFLSGLSIQPEATYYMQVPEDAVGGVRLVMWNNQLSPGPAAVTLLSLIAVEDAIDLMAKPDSPKK